MTINIAERIMLLQRSCKVAFAFMVVAIVLASGIFPASVLAKPLRTSTITSEVREMTPDAVRSLVERAATSWTKGDARAFAALFTPDGELAVPGQQVVGREAIEQVAAEFAKSHTQVNIKIQRIMTDQQRAVVEWQWEDTETSTGKQTRADDAIVIDFVDGYVKRWREYIDSQTPSVK